MSAARWRWRAVTASRCGPAAAPGKRSTTASRRRGCTSCATATPSRIGDLELRPYTVPHDAREPLQLVCSDGAARLGVLTDAGSVTQHMREQLARCDALLLECNHDMALLAASSYPASLKTRIAGPRGHLANEAAAALLAACAHAALRHVVAAHLSEHNNRPELACGALAGAIGCGSRRLHRRGSDARLRLAGDLVR